MHIRHRNTLRLVLAVVLGLGAVGLGVLAVSVRFGLTADYGVGGSGDVPLYVAFFALPVLTATLAAMAWPGPVAGSPSHCVAGVDGDGQTAVRAYRAAWRDAGWRFVTDTPGRVGADHGDTRSTIYVDGDQPLLRVEVRDRT